MELDLTNTDSAKHCITFFKNDVKIGTYALENVENKAWYAAVQVNGREGNAMEFIW